MMRQRWMIAAGLLVVSVGLFGHPARAQDAFLWKQAEGPYGGIIITLASDPHTGTLWMYAAQNNLYASYDGGDTWRPTGLTGAYIKALAFRKDSVVFADEYRSLDQGHSWTRMGLPDSLSVHALAVDSLTGNVIAAGKHGLYYSSDSGETWQRSWEQGSYYPHLFADVQGYVFAIPDDQYPELIRSADGGASWAVVPSPTGMFPVSFAISPDSTLYLSTITKNSPWRSYLYASSDHGDTWTRIAPVESMGCPAEELLGFNADGDLFMAGIDVYRLAADFQSCTSVFDTTEPYHEASTVGGGHGTRSALLDTRNQVFIAPSYGGFYRSQDNGQSWALSTTGIKATIVQNLYVDEQTGVIWAGTNQNGLFRSEDGGQTWSLRGFAAQSIARVTAGAAPGEWWVATYWDGTFRSQDDGATWTYVPNDRLQGILVDFQYHRPSQTLFARYNKHDNLYYSQDEGQHWIPITFPPLDNRRHVAVAMTVTAAGHIYASAYYEPFWVGGPLAIYRTTDLGQTWETIEQSFAESPFAGTGLKLFVDTTDRLWVSIGTKLYYTEDDGATWTLAVEPPSHLTAFTETQDGTLWLGLCEGILRSTDRGQTWQAPDEGLTHRYIYTLTSDPGTNEVLVGTGGGGVFRGGSSTAAVSVAEAHPVPSAHAVRLVNYPNPFDRMTTIAFDVPQDGPVRLTLYDLLGRKITQLLDQPLPQGAHRIPFDASRLPHGTYFYRLETPAGTFTKQMTHIR